MPAFPVKEEVEHPLFFQEPMHEVELGLAVLTEVLPRGVRPAQAPLHVAVDPCLGQHRLDDVDGTPILEDARPFAVRERRDRRAEPHPEEELTTSVPCEADLVGDAVEPPRAALRVLHGEERAPVQHVLGDEAHVLRREVHEDRER